MPETSIVIKTQDKSSGGLKTIVKNAADLGSKLRDLQDKAHSLSKKTDKARSENSSSPSPPRVGGMTEIDKARHA